MSLLQITINFIGRIAVDHSDSATQRLRAELTALLATGNEGWLPEDIYDGSEAFEELWHQASEATRQRISQELDLLAPTWLGDLENPDAVESSQASARALAATLIAAPRILNNHAQLLAHLQQLNAEHLIRLVLAYYQAELPTARLLGLIESWIDLGGSATVSERESTLLTTVSRSKEPSRNHLLIAAPHVELNAVLRRRIEQHENLVVGWIDQVLQFESIEPDEIATMDPVLTGLPIHKPSLQAMFRAFYLALARNVLTGRDCHTAAARLARVLDPVLLKGTYADGTFDFIATKIWTNDVREFAQQMGIGLEFLKRIEGDLHEVIRFPQASELFKFTSPRLLKALKEGCPEAFAQLMADKVVPLINDVDSIENESMRRMSKLEIVEQFC